MKRFLMLLATVLTVGLFLPGCEDEDNASAAAEYGVQEGERPKTEKRPPPGPAQGGFQEGDEEGAVEPPSGDD